MRSFFYSIVLVSILGFGFFISSKSLASGEQIPRVEPKLPYEVIEVLPSGKENHINGGSANYNPVTIIGDLNLPYNPEDKVYVFPDPKLGIGSTIRLLRAPIISIKDGKRSKVYRSWVTTVGDLFAEKNIEIGADDKVSASLSSQIFDGSQITITRVAITNIVETKSVDFQIQNKEDPNLDYGKKRTVAGEKGEKKLTYRVRREDGDEVERTLLNTEITKQPVTEIHYTGTKVTVLSSVRGIATIGPKQCSIVSANYKAGTLVRITNSANGVKVFGTVDCTWGTATAPPGIVLDLSTPMLSSLKWNGSGAGPNVLVEEIKQ
jgi:hypothetical protein